MIKKLSKNEFMRKEEIEFLAECEIESRKIHQLNKERDYAELLKKRAADEVVLRDRAMIGFEKICE